MQDNQGLIKIDLAALRANLIYLDKKMLGLALLAPAVKTNAYGLGIPQVAAALYKGGARTFFVAVPAEGIGLRAILPEADIYVLAGFDKIAAPAYKEHRLHPVLNSLHDMSLYIESNFAGPCAIHFDTGMNRLGLGNDETQKFLQDAENYRALDVALILSHFACADEKDNPATSAQYQAFKKIADTCEAYFPEAKKSLSNSSGIFRDEKYHFDLCRPGMALYGLNPTPETVNPMQAVVEMQAAVLQVRRARKGEAVGYAGAHILPRDTMLATIGIGYADGFARSLSGHGKLYWRGRPCPILGRVSMDLTMIDLSGIPEKDYPAPGDQVEVLGPHQDADALAADAGTIGYEILTSLGTRFRRDYIGA